jgi:hypothetical protein
VTFALKTMAGADPSATDAVVMRFRNGTGGFVTRTITAALSITIPAAATLGWLANFGYRMWIAAFDDAGTVRLAVRSCQYLTSGTYAVLNPDEAQVASSLAPPANATWQFYSGVAVTSKYWKWIAYANYEATNACLTTPGNWSASPNLIEIVNQSTPRPGQPIYTYRNMVQTTDNVSVTAATAIGGSYVQTAQTTCNLISYVIDGYIYLRTGATNGQGSITQTRNASNISNTGPNVYTGAATDMIGMFSGSVVDKPPAGANTYRAYAHNATAALIQYALNSTTIMEIMG